MWDSFPLSSKGTWFAVILRFDVMAEWVQVSGGGKEDDCNLFNAVEDLQDLHILHASRQIFFRGDNFIETLYIWKLCATFSGGAT